MSCFQCHVSDVVDRSQVLLGFHVSDVVDRSHVLLGFHVSDVVRFMFLTFLKRHVFDDVVMVLTSSVSCFRR